MKLFKPIYIFPLVLLGLLTGILGGWTRLGYSEWNISGAASNHGTLMVGGFLGTLISLERAMVMKNKFWLLFPLISGLSIPVLLWLGWPTVGVALLFIASLGLMAIMYLQTIKHPVLYQFIMSVGAASWLLGNFMLLNTGLVAAAVPWWMGFLLLTIVGERLELSKFLPTPKWAKKGLALILGFFILGIWLPFHGSGSFLMGLSVLLVSVWLLYFDMAKIASKKSGQFKYIGIGLRVGYLWLFLNGVILVFSIHHPLYYDLFLHTFFLGFTFSMIWAHAPIILPMVLNIKEKPYHPILWFGWSIFQLSLVGRIASSILKAPDLRSVFGFINGWSIMTMFALMAGVVILKRLYAVNHLLKQQIESS
ncbi:hypothetical protein SAMN00777080_4650 [Aquiflexum balticum DSM 16537]|uniref:NnrS protein n=1 Tax=Aquiflexum balticum DSM 16537 TaxID=758820 RepID=A0A1W2HAS9_9BACT|nr:hypothetical protein [Aquiflexum balticum]SMD45977.1 hypothetical protein SAMN00777080_4650 [Aquiflexum balticum DSM 16537]